ncbi:hypothetical protein A3B33_00470 [Candidatus Adlerbacteria bacterium RIFCSPLOWO2_01_FULL_54_16]|uniref:Uncharacterized protein n=1 Tax=Candidatus Adlerbacteria bacterium RIFCSPLOWO2_01_FULL_54_16 TaxID=1797244 RepID=A0A1F4Y185_9BACT|nr:MAG: hypothetical protein A3B33_00470 [Candidatus Adlerbacteria bacterium RIFCSPLOWO2_01_FULL_54_16]
MAVVRLAVPVYRRPVRSVLRRARRRLEYRSLRLVRRPNNGSLRRAIRYRPPRVALWMRSEDDSRILAVHADTLNLPFEHTAIFRPFMVFREDRIERQVSAFAADARRTVVSRTGAYCVWSHDRWNQFVCLPGRDGRE